MVVHSTLIRNLMKLKGKAKPFLQYHSMTPKESYFTQFEILQIQENFTLWLRQDLNPGPLTPFTHMLPLDHRVKGKWLKKLLFTKF